MAAESSDDSAVSACPPHDWRAGYGTAPECRRCNKDITETMLQAAFLLLSWDDRQTLKRMLDDEQRDRLRLTLDGEPNW